MAERDIVVVGASAGGVEALSSLARALPAELPAALFVVLHLPPNAVSVLPAILQRAGALPASAAENGQTIVRGHIYVCPPDHHLLVHMDRIELTRGPRENGHRPAVDPLFRSAAQAYGPRVVSIVLSGTLDDGTLGTVAVKARGGVGVVQDPADAAFPGMPQSVIEYNNPDYVVPVAEMGTLLLRLAQPEERESTVMPLSNGPGDDPALFQEEIAAAEVSIPQSPLRRGTPSVFSCPDCGGTLWETEHEDVLGFRCRVGHAFTAQSLGEGQSNELERALWAALRALDERAALTRRLRNRAATRGQDVVALRFAAQLGEAERSAALVREALMRGERIIYPAPVSADERGQE